MPPPWLAVSRPAVGAREDAALLRAMASGYFGMGPETRAFEEELGTYLGAGRTVLCTSTGSSALHLALAALDLGPGDEVLVPSLTFVASFQAVAATGARAIACDVSLNSGLLDVDDAGRRLTTRTRAVLPVHYAGYPGDLDAIYAFARDHRLRVVEDAAHAFGSEYQGSRIGGIGDVVCFSFDPIKNVTAGQGGAVVTADAEIARRVRAMRNLGIERAASPADEDEFEVEGPGWRYQMSDLMAAIGRVQLQRFESELKPARLDLIRYYRDRLDAVSGVRLLESSSDTVSHIFPIRVPELFRARVREALAADGYETRLHYKPNHRLAAFSDGNSRPATERLYRELITLPLHPGVTEEAAGGIVDTIEGALASS